MLTRQRQQAPADARKAPRAVPASAGPQRANKVCRRTLLSRAAATPLGAASPFYNPAAPPRARAEPGAAVRHYFGNPLATVPSQFRTTHAAAPPPRVVRTGGLKRKDAKQADPTTPPLGELVHDPAHPPSPPPPGRTCR